MPDWISGLHSALSYIEDHLTEEILPEDVAQKAYVSAYHFQRIFHALCGVTLGEYIRCRRLTLAAQELTRGETKVIDVALKYGYDSPDSFARAFQKFHGVLPSAAKEKGAKLNAFSPLRINLTLEGGTMLEYRIVEKPAFTLMGIGKMFNNETSYQEIPPYWGEYLQSDNRHVCGQFGACIDADGRSFKYLIADVYQPWREVPAGYETVTFPAGTWAVFPCRMDNLQDVNTRMWKEWLPACKDYRLGRNCNLEYYTPPEENYAELWLPVERRA